MSVVVEVRGPAETVDLAAKGAGSLFAGDGPSRPERIRTPGAVRDLFLVNMEPAATTSGRAPLPTRTGGNVVGVFLADAERPVPPPREVLATMAVQGFAGACLSTAHGPAEPLAALLSSDAVVDFVDDCRLVGLTSLLDGGLDEADLPLLATVRADHLIFRRQAVTRHPHSHRIDFERLERIMTATSHAQARKAATHLVARIGTVPEFEDILLFPGGWDHVAFDDEAFSIVRPTIVTVDPGPNHYTRMIAVDPDGLWIRTVADIAGSSSKDRTTPALDLRHLAPSGVRRHLEGYGSETRSWRNDLLVLILDPALGEGLPGVLKDMARLGFRGAMLRPSDDRRLLSDRSAVATCVAFVRVCRELGLDSHLAGRIEAPDLSRLEGAFPDFVHVDGGVRTDGRLDASKIALCRKVLSSPVALRRADGSVKTDRILVKDLVVDMRIGAYDFERDRTQKVSFSAEVDVLRGSAASDLSDIFSYDWVMDGVRTLVDRGHTDLVETLAEELAEHVLAHPRAVKVVVRVEKLELGPAACGIEIVRPD